MQRDRDPDDAPVDPTAEDDAAREARPPAPADRGPTDPDALRPARVAGGDAPDAIPDE